MEKKRILFITGDIPKTICGVSKFTVKLSLILEHNGFDTKTIYSNIKSQDSIDKNLVKYKNKNIALKFINLLPLIKEIRDFKPTIINIQYNSCYFSKNLFLSFLPLILKVFFYKTEIQSTIHEFSSFKVLGRIRHIIPALFSDKVFFSDQRQMMTASKFSLKFIATKSYILPLGSSMEIKENKFDLIIKNNNTFNICFHGLIQPKNGLEYLLESIYEISQTNQNIKLHILGSFELLIDYAGETKKVHDYQIKLLNYINTYLKDKVVIYGDIDPSSEKFKEILKNMDICVIPDIDYITIRRTSFWNVFLQSNIVMFAPYKDEISDKIMSSVVNISPKSSLDIKDKILNYIVLPFEKKAEIFKKQNEMRAYMDQDNLTKIVIESFN